MTRPTLNSCFYYPTTAVFLDDSKPFLDKIGADLSDHLPYQCFTNPDKALAYIKEHNRAKQFQRDILSASIDSPEYGMNPQRCQTELDLSVLSKQLYDPKRFSEATVLVVDYAMPDIDGLAFCKQLDGLPIKKILLTGQADEKLAVTAFNSGLIDHFVSKSSPHFGQAVNQAISELQQEYFKEWSALVLNNLLIQDDCSLRYPDFIKTFYDICEKHHIVEYYVLENSGSFLLLNEAGKPFWLIARTALDVRDACVVAKDHHAPQHVIDQLEKAESLAYFINGKDFMEVEGADWEKHLFPATPVNSKKSAYYSLVEDVPFFDLKKSKISSLYQYLEG